MSSSGGPATEAKVPALPEQIPTRVAFAALGHVLSHGHDGLEPFDHYAGALLNELGLMDADLAAAEQALVSALHSHPRDQVAIDAAMTTLDRVLAREKKPTTTSGDSPSKRAR